MNYILFLSILLFTLSFTSCEEQEETKDYLCVIQSPVVHSADSTYTSAEAFYGQNNFILYDSVTILYHNKSVFYSCGTGIDFTKPGRLYLTPDSLVRIKYTELDHFLKTKFNWRSRFGRNILSIASSSDTIRNKAYTLLMNFQKRHPNMICSVRKWTEEEKYAALAKIKGQPYEYHQIKWKIGFSDGSESLKLEEIMRFLPPEIENKEKPAKKKLAKYFYPNMSGCGGAVYGYYDDKTLVKIDATYRAELGFKQQIINYANGRITHFTYIKHAAEWGKYLEKYPEDEETDEKKMTYTDERVEIDFTTPKKIRTFSRDKPVKNVITSEEINQMLDCAKEMERELASEKIKETP